MSKKRSILEILKTCLIVLLFVSALFLAARTRLFDAFFASVPLLNGSGLFSDSGADAPSSTTFGEASRPVQIVITGNSGHYAGSGEALYESTGALLGEALGSSRAPMAVTAADWRGALGADSIYFEYPDPVRLSVLAGWFGSDVSHEGGNSLVRRLCIAAGSADPVLYYIDESSGNIYRCGTAASAAALGSLTAAYLPNGSGFVFELGERFDHVDPYLLLPAGTELLPTLSASTSIGAELEAAVLLNCFDMNTHISLPYTEQNGDTVDTVYVEGNSTLRAASNGLVTFRQDAAGERLPVSPASGMDEAAAVEAARQFIERLAAVIGGEGRFYLRACQAAQDVYTVSFSVFVGDMRVFLPGDSPAAELVIDGGHIREAKVYFRSYSYGQDSASVLPVRQAIAVADSAGWETAVLGFSDMLSAPVLMPEWLLKGGA